MTDSSKIPGETIPGHEYDDGQRREPSSQETGQIDPGTQVSEPHNGSPSSPAVQGMGAPPAGSTLRRLKKSVERAISRATGELQAYSDALTTLVQERHIKHPDEESEPEPSGTPSAPSSPYADGPVKEDAGSALRRLASKSSKKRKSRMVNVDAETVDKLIQDVVVESALDGQARIAREEQQSAQSPTSPVGQSAGALAESRPRAVMPQAPLPIDEHRFAPPEAPVSMGERQFAPPEAPVSIGERQFTPPEAPGSIDESQLVPPPPSPARQHQTGFHNLLQRAGKAVERSTGELHLYSDAVSKLVQQRAHGERPQEPSATPEPQGGGLTGFVGRAIRRTTGEMAALRSQLMGLVDEARQKEQVKSQERLQNLTTTERLPIPEKLENYKFATLCPSQWDAMSGSDQYRHCQECGLFVYEFATQNQSEAAKIVFQREGNDRPTFYKRGDGRFLTRDCPVGVGRRQKRILGMVAAMVVGLGAVALMFLAPPPKPPEVMQQPEPNWEDEEIVDEPKSKKKVAPAGEGHARFSLPKARPQPSEYNNNDQAPILTPPDIGVPPQ